MYVVGQRNGSREASSVKQINGRLFGPLTDLETSFEKQILERFLCVMLPLGSSEAPEALL
jgi:hypothetical protein